VRSNFTDNHSPIDFIGQEVWQSV